MFKCAAIDKNVRIEGSAITGLRVLPCCVYQTDKNYKSLNEYYSSDEYQQLKEAKEWPAGCSACQKQEQQKQTSYRQHANQSLTGISGKRFEIFPSNICNLKCVMCTPASSSALAKEQHTLGMASEQYTKEFDLSDEVINLLNQVDSIESISLIGGEFFLSKGNLKILDFALEHSLPVRAVTNATLVLPGHLDKLQQLNDLELQISCDGINDYYEFMRYPAKWGTFLDNASKLISALPKAKINFHFVVQPLNVKNLIPSLAFLNTLKKATRVTNLVYPEHLSWIILTDDERTNIVSSMRQQLNEFKLLDKQRIVVQELIDTIQASKYSEIHKEKFNATVKKTLEHRGFNMVEVERFELPTNSV